MVTRRKVRVGLNGVEDRPDLTELMKNCDSVRTLELLHKSVGAISPDSRARILQEIYEGRGRTGDLIDGAEDGRKA